MSSANGGIPLVARGTDDHPETHKAQHRDQKEDRIILSSDDEDADDNNAMKIE